MKMFRLRKQKKRKYDWWGCWIRPALIVLRKTILNIISIVVLTTMLLIVVDKWCNNEEYKTPYQTPDEFHQAQLEELESNEVGNNYYTSKTKEIVYPLPIIEDCPLSAPFQNWIYDTCEAYGVDFYIVMSVIYHESRYDVNAYNPTTGCVGLMQIMVKYHQDYLSDGTPIDLQAPCENVLKGIQLLSAYTERFGDIRSALVYYSGGSESYANNVLEYAERLRG